MPSAKKRHPVSGSERTTLPGAHLVGPADPQERVLITILLRRRASSPGVAALIQEQGSGAQQQRKYLSHEEFSAAHGADPGDVEKIEDFAHEHGLDVVEVHPTQRRIVLSGTVAAASTAFGVYLARYEHPAGSYRGRVGEVLVPEDLAPIVEGVFGLDNRPQAYPHFRVLSENRGATQPHAGGLSFTPPQVARLYDFPNGVNGSGQCVAIIELGGGYRASDLKTYFSHLGIPTPTVRSVSVDGGHNHPTGNANGPDGEVMLDIEVAGAVAPGARIVVYFAPNTDAGFLDAIKTAVHDVRNKPSVVSISWGAAESGWTTQAMQAMDQTFQDAAALGVTVCCASGDDGSGDRVNDGQAHVDFPASSLHALACGGTRLEGSGSTISKEIVWNEGAGNGATGGGVSDTFALPSWQTHANVPPSANPGGHIGRGVPDVSGDADPATGYQVLVDGQQFAIGGTSAVAPLWAGLIALINQKLGHPGGYLNPLLYGLPGSSGAFHDITNGDNGAYQARPGWDPCTGLGSPDGAKLLAALGTH
jgi:kumamolisin